MTTAEIALLISGFSAGIALLALGWNIYRDIILRPKVKVRLQISEILTPGDRGKNAIQESISTQRISDQGQSSFKGFEQNLTAEYTILKTIWMAAP